MTKSFIERVLNDVYSSLAVYDRYIELTSDVNTDGTPDVIQKIDNYTLITYYKIFATKNGFYNNINWDIAITDISQLSQIFSDVETYCITNNI